MYYIETIKQELSTALLRPMSIIYLTRSLSLIDIDVIWVFVDEEHSKLPTLNWLPNLHKYPLRHVLLLTLAQVLLLSCR